MQGIWLGDARHFGTRLRLYSRLRLRMWANEGEAQAQDEVRCENSKCHRSERRTNQHRQVQQIRHNTCPGFIASKIAQPL